MGVVESIRGILWARRRQPEEVAYGVALAHERFQPDELVVLQTLAAWGESDEAALAGSREWKGTLVDEHYTDSIADPAEIGSNGAEVSDSTFKAQAIVSADPDAHVKKIRVLEKLGATAVCVMNVSGADPVGMLRTYGESVLPALRDR